MIRFSRTVAALTAAFLVWLTTHPYGANEKNNGNDHSTCWVMQVVAFASLTGDQAILDDCRRFFKERLLPTQMAADGSFPRELSRTKPYGYSLFNLDAMATVCQLLSVPGTVSGSLRLQTGGIYTKP